jgi:hypothetical protein
LEIVALKNLSTSISSYKNKNKIRRSILEKKWKKNGHPKIKYLMLEGCLVKPFVKLGVRKPGLKEFFGLSKNNRFILHPKPTPFAQLRRMGRQTSRMFY